MSIQFLGVPKTHTNLGSHILEKSEIPSLRPKDMHQHHSPILGTFGTSPSTGSHPKDGAPRISLEDQYRIPERLSYYIMGWVCLDQDWIKPPLDLAAKTSPHCPVISITSFNTIAPSSPPPNREDWEKVIGLAEDCTLCKQGNCGYAKPQNKDTHVNTTTWLSARHHNSR